MLNSRLRQKFKVTTIHWLVFVAEYVQRYPLVTQQEDKIEYGIGKPGFFSQVVLNDTWAALICAINHNKQLPVLNRKLPV